MTPPRAGAPAALAVLASLALLAGVPTAALADDEPDSDSDGSEDSGETPPPESDEGQEPETPAEPDTETLEAELEPAPEKPAGSEAGTELPAEADPDDASKHTPWIGVGLVVDFLFPSGRPASGSLGAGQAAPSGDRGFALPLLLSIRGYFQLTEMIALSPGLEIGWFRLQGDGHQNLPNDPDFTSFDYSWHIDNLPIFVGASLMLDPLPDWPLHISAGGGFAALHAWAQTRYDPDGQPAVTSKVQSDWGIGWYVGVEASYSLWLGRITLEYRYSSARTDLEFQDVYSNAPYNSDLGDLQGSHLMLGYRFDFPW